MRMNTEVVLLLAKSLAADFTQSMRAPNVDSNKQLNGGNEGIFILEKKFRKSADFKWMNLQSLFESLVQKSSIVSNYDFNEANVMKTALRRSVMRAYK